MPTLWSILHQIEVDWRDAAAVSVYNGLPQDNNARLAFLFDTYESLTPRYIQCLFSYINFFYLLENGLLVLFDELREISRTLDLRLKLPKKPKRSDYIRKVRLVRNHTVVHWGGPDKKHQLDSRAGRMWGFGWSTAANDLSDLQFGYLSVVGASNRTLKPLGETHRLCTAYLTELDSVSTDLLTEIQARLPLTVGTRDYSVVTK
jgi:hypothetical protein